MPLGQRRAAQHFSARCTGLTAVARGVSAYKVLLFGAYLFEGLAQSSERWSRSDGHDTQVRAASKARALGKGGQREAIPHLYATTARTHRSCAYSEPRGTFASRRVHYSPGRQHARARVARSRYTGGKVADARY